MSTALPVNVPAGRPRTRRSSEAVRGTGPTACHRQAAGGRSGRCRCRVSVADRRAVGRDRERVQADVRVVEGRDADDLRAHAGHAAAVDAVCAGVADRRHDDHALLHEVRRGLAGRRLVPGVERVADGHVQDLHAVVQGTLHRGDHDLVRRRAFTAEDAVRAERHVRSDALHLAVGTDDARDVRAVPVAVVRVGIRIRDRLIRGARRIRVVRVADEVPSLCNPAARTEAAAEIGMLVVRPGIHDRDLHALAREAELVLGDVGARHLERGRELRDGSGLRLGNRDGPDGIDGGHVRERENALELSRGDVDRDAVPQLLELEARRELDARLLGVGIQLLPLGREGGGVAAVCCRRARELDEPGADDVLCHRAAPCLGRRADLGSGVGRQADGYEENRGEHAEQSEHAPARHLVSRH